MIEGKNQFFCGENRHGVGVIGGGRDREGGKTGGMNVFGKEILSEEEVGRKSNLVEEVVWGEGVGEKSYWRKENGIKEKRGKRREKKEGRKRESRNLFFFLLFVPFVLLLRAQSW